MSATQGLATTPTHRLRRCVAALVVVAVFAGGSGFAAPPVQASGPGSLDTSFDPGTGANSEVLSVAIQPDGKSIIVGDFTTYSGLGRNRVARLNTDAGLDATFNPGTGANDDVRSVAVQPDGKILIGGSFSTFNGTFRSGVARLNANGTLDATFDPGTGTFDAVSSVAVQPDGKILIGGSFTSFNGTARNRVARLNADGSLDTSFNPGTGANDVVEVVVPLSGGKVLIGGWFSSFDNIPYRRIVRVNADGSPDVGFNSGTGVSGIVYSVAVQPDGRILIGGFIVDVNSTVRNGIARLNANGSLDTIFNPGSGANESVRSVAVRPDGKIFIGGQFTTFDNTPRVRVALLNALDPPSEPGVPAVVPGLGSLSVTVAGRTRPGGPPTSHVVTATATGSVTTGSGNTCTVAGVSGSCVISGLAANGTYRVSVVAVNDAGNSPAGGAAPLSPLSVTPGAGSVVPEFVDVPAGSFFVRATSMLKLRGITQGTNAAGDVYSPQQPVNRQQMALFLWRMAGSPDSVVSCGFVDEAAIAVSARAAACWLKAQGITTNNPYEPLGVVNRQQMAAFLWRFAGEPTAPAACEFTDEADIAGFAREPACWLKATDITTNNPYRPTGEVTRAQMAAFLYRLGAELDLWVRVDD
jgi:uncharacterized delta-60 repeat protein